MMNRILLALCTIFLLSAAPAAADGTCLASACHQSMALAASVHAPVGDGDCESCHESSGAAHPGDEGAFRLRLTGAALCYSCHQSEIHGKKIVHGVLAEEGCTACHDPHGGPQKYMLPAPSGKLCVTCHPEVIEGARVHGPVAVLRCQVCHDVHASDEPGLLNADGNRVCYNCHGAIKQRAEGALSKHEPVSDGRCWDCHDPHSSDDRPLLKRYYPRGFYVSYRDEDFDLCFGCHDRNAFLYRRTSEATAFRNGDINLHYFHVNRSAKGRVCKGCHGVHGADQQKLIPSRVPGFGNWEIPIRFDPTENGATCTVGCHRPKSYDRLSPVKNL